VRFAIEQDKVSKESFLGIGTRIAYWMLAGSLAKSGVTSRIHGQWSLSLA
jgi:hypothetical protein